MAKGKTRLATAAVAAVIVLALAAAPAMAVSWGSEVRLAGLVNAPEILRTGPSSAIAIWNRPDASAQIRARRTTNSGASWTSFVILASGITLTAAASAVGQNVDLAYVRRVPCPSGGTASRLFYRRSTDGGAHWGAPMALTSACSKISDQDVARGPGGRVTVVWTGQATGRLFTRTSANGGTSFSAARFVAQTSNAEPGPSPYYSAQPAIAIGDDVTYVAYTSAQDTASIRRSRDNGASWSAGTKLTTSASLPYQVVASGARAVVGYSSTASGVSKAVYRRTLDRGSSWSVARVLATHGPGQFSSQPTFAYQAGVLAVIFKFGTPPNSPVWHRQSTNFGVTWGARTRVTIAHGDRHFPEPGGLAILASRQLAGYRETDEAPNLGYWVRRTTAP